MAGNCHFKVYLYFNPRTPRGVRLTAFWVIRIPPQFQSTHPARGATYGPGVGAGLGQYFNPRTPRGVRLFHGGAFFSQRHFNPRTPRGVRRKGSVSHPSCTVFQSTHPARGATKTPPDKKTVAEISIHAPREGCDARRLYCGDHAGQFQSTHPARGATAHYAYNIIVRRISIHAPREGCDVHIFRHRGCPVISIHAPREGCDLSVSNSPMRKSYFNPRTPRGVRHGETCQRTRAGCYFNPRTPRGVRQGHNTKAVELGDFNPRTPRGVRPLSLRVITPKRSFQSTHPARGATVLM